MAILSPLGRWIDDKQYQTDKMSDAELGRRIGLSRQQVGAIKKGQSGTKAEVVRSIARVFSDSKEEEEKALKLWALGDSEDMRADVEITRIVYSLKPEQRPALIRLVQSAADVLNASP